MHTHTLLIALVAMMCLLGACGGDAQSSGGSASSAVVPSGKAAETKNALEALFQLAQAGKNEEAAKYVVYTGRADEARRWKDTSNYANLVEKAQVDAICGRVGNALNGGPATFVEFRTEKESEGEWLIWTVAFGSGYEELRMHIACLEVNGGFAIADID